MQVSEDGLTPAEHRGLRELYATTRQLVSHWSALAARLEGDEASTLRSGVAAARELLDDLPRLTAPHGVHGKPAAQGVGVQLAAARNRVGDAFLERNQALRLAVLDVQHVTTLLGYLERLASSRGDDALAEFHAGRAEQLGRVERQARAAAMRIAQDPDAAVEPLLDSRAGRAAHGMASAVGTAGEWTDRRMGRGRA